jgi:hypothetical protein
MFDQKSVVSKYVGYFLIGFFLFIIILSFGMPDVTGCGTDRSTIAVVNGQKIDHLDFLRYRDTKFAQFRNQKMDSFILDNFILELMLIQKAEKNGFKITEDRIIDYIKKSPEFKNPSTGKFDPEYFQAILRNSRLDIAEFEKLIKRDFTLDDYKYFLSIGGASATEDITAKNIVDNSNIQIQYSFLSAEDIRKNYKNDLTVTDTDIDDEIKNNNVKISDPTTDRERIRKQIEEKKLEKIKNDLAEKINGIAASNGTFTSANSVLRGKTAKSSKFKIGEPVKTEEKEPKLIAALNNSNIFTEKCLTLALNTSSPAVLSGSGIYIFTPIIKTIPTASIDKDTFEKSLNAADNSSANMITRNLLKVMNEKSKVIKNLKTD